MNVDFLAHQRDQEPISDLDSERHAIRSAHLSAFSDISIEFHRGISGDTQNPNSPRQASPYYDEVSLRANASKQGPPGAQNWLTCIDTIESALPRTYAPQESRQGPDAIYVLRAEIAELAGQYRRMLGGLADERAAFRKESEGERKAARAEYAAEQLRLETGFKDQRNEFDEYKQREQDRLQKQRDELDQRKQELDDRQHMHARRELWERISRNFRERVAKPVVSNAATRMRQSVFWLTLGSGCAIAAAGVGIGIVGDSMAVEGPEVTPGWLTVTHVARSILLLVLGVGFVAYAISWRRAIYLDDVRAERRYEKYGYDIDRASFVIETIIEVGEREDMQVPDTWIGGVCRNLFEDNTDRSADNSPNQPLAALFETISGAKFGSGGAEFSIDRRDARRFAKKHSGG